MGYLVLLRHGESLWNLENRFTGWVEVPLSPKGEVTNLGPGRRSRRRSSAGRRETQGRRAAL